MNKYLWRNVIAGIFVILLSLSLSSTPHLVFAEANGNGSEGGADETEILTILTTEILPFAALRDGKQVGFGVEILNEIMLRLGRSDNIEFDDWSIMYKRVLTEPNTVLMPPSRTPEREELFKWVGPLVLEKIVLFARKDSDLIIKSPKDAKKVGSIATVTGYASEKLLKKMKFKNLLSQSSSLEGPKALKSGRVDLWLNSNITMREIAIAAGVDPDLFEPVFVFNEIPSYLAFSKDVPDQVVSKWQTALDDMKMDGTWERIVSRWIPSDLRSIKSAPPRLSITPFLALSNLILACFLSIVIFNMKTRGNRWLSLLLLLFGALSLLRWGMFAESHFIVVYLPVICFPAIYLIGPTLLKYTEYILFDKKPKLHWHLIVPAIASMIHVYLLFAMPDQWSFSLIKNMEGIHKVYGTSHAIGMALYIMTFGSIAFYRIITYKKRFKDNFSTDIIRNTQWMNYFIFGNLGIITFSVFIVMYSFIFDLGIPFTITEDIILLFVLMSFIYYLITKPDILPIATVAEEKPEKKYAKVSLPDETRRQFANKLESFMVEKQAFLDENLSVRQISEELNIPQHHLSMTINIEFEQNFFNYVNRYRIRYAEDLLKDTEESEESILMIAYRSGFQSKTSFNKAFKTTSGMTPTQYRKIHLPQIS